MTPQQLFEILLARRRQIFRVFAAVLVAAVVGTLLLPRQYTASATVIIDVRADPLAGLAYQSQTSSATFMATQLDIATSQRVARKVVDVLDLTTSPQFAGRNPDSIARQLRGAVWAAPTARNSNVMAIYATWPTPELAAGLANGFARAYIDTTIDLKIEPAKQYADWFDERVAELRSDLEARQRRLADYERENGFIVTSDSLDLETTRLAELSSELITIQSQRQQSASRRAQARSDAEALPEVLQNPTIVALKGTLAQAEALQRELSARLGSAHPEYQRVAGEVTNLRLRIADESVAIATSLGVQLEVNKQSEQDALDAFEAQKRRVLSLRDRRDAGLVLQNDVAATQRSLDAVTERQAMLSLESQSQATNIMLLGEANVPGGPSSPNMAFSVLLGSLLGLGLGCVTALVLELLDRRVRSATDVELMGLPVLVCVSPMTPPATAPPAPPPPKRLTSQ